MIHMRAETPTRILFTGYAAVHFVCFKPLYERLVKIPGVEVAVSGGLRTKTDDDTRYDEQAMYAPFNLPPKHVLPVDDIRTSDFDVLFAANTNLIMPRSAALRIQLFHGISFRNKAIRAENMGCDYYFIVGPYMHARFAEAGLLGADDPRGVPIGFPKTDNLLSGEFNRSLLLERYGFDPSLPVLLYAPTGQKYNSLETMGEEALARLNQTRRFNVLVKLHDHPKEPSIDWRSHMMAMESDQFRVATEADVTPLMRLADLLITDASSVSSEFSLLNRPMVFLNVPKLLERAGRAEHSMLDLNTWGFNGGHLVEKADDVVEIVDRSLAQPVAHAGIRLAMARDLFYNPGRATDASINWLRQNVFGAAIINKTAAQTA